MGTALFERFDGDACDQMLQRSGSALLLEQLAGQQVFMLPIDQHPGWFRYQTLFREFLIHRLAIEQPERIGLLNGRAARYFLTRDDPEQALQHARASGDNALFRDVLAICCARWARTGHASRIIEWLSAMPDDELLQDRRLLVPLIDALILSRRFHEAGYYLDQAAQGEIEPACLHCLKLTLKLYPQTLANLKRLHNNDIEKIDALVGQLAETVRPIASPSVKPRSKSSSPAPRAA